MRDEEITQEMKDNFVRSVVPHNEQLPPGIQPPQAQPAQATPEFSLDAFANSCMTLFNSQAQQGQQLIGNMINTTAGLWQELQEAKAKVAEQEAIIKQLSGEQKKPRVTRVK